VAAKAGIDHFVLVKLARPVNLQDGAQWHAGGHHIHEFDCERKQKYNRQDGDQTPAHKRHFREPISVRRSVVGGFDVFHLDGTQRLLQMRLENGGQPRLQPRPNNLPSPFSSLFLASSFPKKAHIKLGPPATWIAEKVRHHRDERSLVILYISPESFALGGRIDDGAVFGTSTRVHVLLRFATLEQHFHSRAAAAIIRF